MTDGPASRVKDVVTEDTLVELRKLLPKGIAVNQALKIHKEEIIDLLYQLYSNGYEEGQQEGYDDGEQQGYDRGYEDGKDTEE